MVQLATAQTLALRYRMRWDTVFIVLELAVLAVAVMAFSYVLFG